MSCDEDFPLWVWGLITMCGQKVSADLSKTDMKHSDVPRMSGAAKGLGSLFSKFLAAVAFYISTLLPLSD